MVSPAIDRPVQGDVDALIAHEEQGFLRRQPRSTELIALAGGHLAGSATSNWQIAQPQAVWMSHGAGSKVYDVDGTEYVDMHGGYGASIAGHAHPAIVAAVSTTVPVRCGGSPACPSPRRCLARRRRPSVCTARSP